MKAAISMNELEYVLYYLLRFYRDDIASAEHIDIDFDFDKGVEVTLVLIADVYKLTDWKDANLFE